MCTEVRAAVAGVALMTSEAAESHIILQDVCSKLAYSLSVRILTEIILMIL